MYVIASGDASERRRGHISVRHEDRNGHAFENMARHAAQNKFAQTRVAIGTRDDHDSTQIGRFVEQQIADRHVARYGPDRLRIAAMSGNLIGNIEPVDVV